MNSDVPIELLDIEWQPTPPPWQSTLASSILSEEDNERIAAAMEEGKHEAERRMAAEFQKAERAVEEMSIRRSKLDGKRIGTELESPPPKRVSLGERRPVERTLDMQLEIEQEAPQRKRMSLERPVKPPEAAADLLVDSEAPPKRVSVGRRSLADTAPPDLDATHALHPIVQDIDREEEADEEPPAAADDAGAGSGPPQATPRRPRAKPTKVLHSRHAMRIPGAVPAAVRARQSIERVRARRSDRRSLVSGQSSRFSEGSQVAQYV